MNMDQLTEQQRYDMASDIATAAGYMNWMKLSHTPEVRDGATAQINRLHEIAATLAGSRSAEIYALDDEQPTEKARTT